MNKNRLEKLEKNLHAKCARSHNFLIMVGPGDVECRTRYYMDNQEVSEAEFKTYPRERPVKIRVTLSGSPRNTV